MMKPGRLFEEALKHADIDLKSGTELKVQVKGKGNHLRLVVTPPKLNEFETIILERSKKVAESKTAYQPTLPLGEIIKTLRKTAGLTLDALAKKAEMSKGSLCSIEKGTRPAGLAVLRKLAKALNAPLSILIK